MIQLLIQQSEIPMGQPKGTCRLCQHEGVELCDSHVLPKFAYRRIKGSGKNLCEDRFMKVEHRWAPLAYADGKFPIHDNLGKAIGDKNELAREFGSLSREDSIYLAASVIWRGSVCTRLKATLGKYNEDFRLFLLGTGNFPRDAEVMLSVLGQEKSDRFPEMYRVLVPPWSEKTGRCHIHRFFLCGCLFAIWVGGQCPWSLNHHGLVRGTNHTK